MHDWRVRPREGRRRLGRVCQLEHFPGFVTLRPAFTADNAAGRSTSPEKWLYSWMCGSWAAWEAGFGACEVQHREGDEGFGSVEAERDSGDQSDLGVD